jgi:hypothetical protein
MLRLRIEILLLVLSLLGVPALAEDSALEFQATDKSFSLKTEDDFRVTFNPHAVLSLANLDEVAVVVTKRKAESSVETLYDAFPKSLPPAQRCLGRMMITVDAKQAAAFVIEGMFPPEGDPTHQTLLTVVIHEGQEYNFMVHYPLENETSGLEDAYALMGSVKWLPASVKTEP